MSTKTTRYRTLNETADVLRTHPRTLRRWCEQGKVPFLRLGRRYLFMDDDLASLRTQPLATREAIIA
jgi:excisionase family DNA binding protein